ERRSVDMEIVGGDARVLRGDRLELPVPQPPRVDQDVVLVNQGDLVAAGGSAFESVADDSLDPVRGVDAHLRRDLLWCADSHQAAIAAVKTFGALANDDEVDLVPGDHLLGQWGRYAGIQAAGPEVHIVIESEAQLEQQAPLEQSARHVRCSRCGAYRTEQDHVISGRFGP